MVTNNPNQSIEKQLVPVSMRATALMRHFPSSWFNVENQVFTVMSQIAPDYCGGDWDFIELSNGAFLWPLHGPIKLLFHMAAISRVSWAQRRVACWP